MWDFSSHEGETDGSEFHAEFEEACQALGIPLLVLPPRSPRLSGTVERTNDSAGVEFRSQYAGALSFREAGHALADCRHFYNCVRPHCVLELMTPRQELDNVRNRTPQSHMW